MANIQQQKKRVRTSEREREGGGGECERLEARHLESPFGIRGAPPAAAIAGPTGTGSAPTGATAARIALEAHLKRIGIPLFPVSAATGKGIPDAAFYPIEGDDFSGVPSRAGSAPGGRVGPHAALDGRGPLRLGGGTRLKIIEAMAAELPVSTLASALPRPLIALAPVSVRFSKLASSA